MFVVFVLQQGDGFFDGLFFFVGLFVCQCIEDVGDGDDVCFDWNVFICQFVWIIVVIEFFVVEQGDVVCQLQ